MNLFERKLLQSTPVKLGEYKGFEIRYMNSDVMGEYFGYALNDKIFVRYMLSERVQAFVISHEKHHLVDRYKWLGWFGAELRANTICGLKNPVGFLATVKASMTRSRIETYLKLMKVRGRVGSKVINR